MTQKESRQVGQGNGPAKKGLVCITKVTGSLVADTCDPWTGGILIHLTVVGKRDASPLSQAELRVEVTVKKKQRRGAHSSKTLLVRAFLVTIWWRKQTTSYWIISRLRGTPNAANKSMLVDHQLFVRPFNAKPARIHSDDAHSWW